MSELQTWFICPEFRRKYLFSSTSIIFDCWPKYTYKICIYFNEFQIVINHHPQQVDIVENNMGNYLSAGEMPLPSLYFMMSLLFFLSGLFWLFLLKKSK